MAGQSRAAGESVWRLVYAFSLLSGSTQITFSTPILANDNKSQRVGRNARAGVLAYGLNRLSKDAFVTTETELKAIAPAAIIGLSSQWVIGYSMPAAIGIDAVL